MLSKGITIIAFLAAAWCWTSDANMFYNVACPGVNIELQCPEGQTIEVLNMEDGPKDTVDCAATTTAVTVANETSLHRGMLPWSKSVCDKMEKCRLPKTDEDMFAANDVKENFIQTTYACRKKSAGTQTSMACDKDEAQLACDTGVINIVKASYGRLDQYLCTTVPSIMTFCISYQAESRVKDICQNKANCTIPVSYQTLGRPGPCDNMDKYLIVDYICQ